MLPADVPSPFPTAVRPKQQPRRPRPDPPAPSLVVFAIAALFLARIPLLASRVFDPDEFEHAHAAWCLFRGMLPYKDFFEHHTPWYYYTLRPFFYWFDVAGSFESARHFLLFGRGLSYLLTVVSILLAAEIGRLWRNRHLGLIAGFLLLGQPIFFEKTLEMRPDVLALPFFLGCLYFLLRGLGTDTAPPRKPLIDFVRGGLALGAAVMCTQKMLFVLPGLLVALALWSLASDRRANRFPTFRARATLIVAFTAAVALPGLLTWGAFALQHGGRAFITNNFLLNAHWKNTPTGDLVLLLKGSAPVLVLALLGLGVAAHRRLHSPSPSAAADLLLAGTGLGLFVGLLLIPVAQKQYYLMPLPIVCLFAADGLRLLIDHVKLKWRAAFSVLALLGLSVLPAHALWLARRMTNDHQLAQLRQVYETTAPSDLVMDGWKGMGVFRPHAFYYYFVHDELLPMLPPDRVAAFVDRLERGEIRPKLIALDEHLIALSPRFVAFVKRNYLSADGFFYYRN